MIEPFADAYRKGLTPNPCILCNRYIKFPYLLKIADERSAGFIATGHYAKVAHATRHGDTETWRHGEREILSFADTPIPRYADAYLKKGIDPKKDQSYVLYALRQEELNRLILPLGERTKDEVRQLARKLNLPSAARPESQEICFIEEKNYFGFIDNLFSEDKSAGPVIDIESGKTLGSHKGIHAYTIGQRKGFGISSPEPLYVVKIDAEKNAIYVGGKDAAKMGEFMVEDLNWLLPPSASSFRASVKVRSTMKDEPAALTVLADGKVRIVYDEPQWAPAPGQSAVFYDGDTVIGGGVISNSMGIRAGDARRTTP